MDSEGARGEPPEGSSLAEKRVAFFCLLGALLLTVAVRLFLFKNYYTINNDGVLYIEAARRFWEGKWFEGLASFYPPVFPAMIALIYPLLGDWELAGQFWPFTLGILTLLPLFFVLQRCYDTKTAHIALFLYAVSPYLARFSLHVRSELPYIFFLVSALYFLQRGMAGKSLPSLLLMGVCSALAYLIRSEGFGVFIVGVLYLLYRGWAQGNLRRRLSQVFFLAAGFVLLAAPYVLYLRYDTGKWLISRKAGFIMSLGLARYDLNPGEVEAQDSEKVEVVGLIASNPLGYAKKVFVDFFRFVGVYFEALHYSYLPFLFVGWFFFFRGRFWEREAFLFVVLILFYAAAFALFHVTRRYAIPLIPLSLGWVAAGCLAVEQYFRFRFKERRALLTAILLVLFVAGTLPKTLQAIGKEKFYLREAALYLKKRPGRPTIITTNARVAFYADGQNTILVRRLEEIAGLLDAPGETYIALDEAVLRTVKSLVGKGGWMFERDFSDGRGERLLVFTRQRN